MNSPVVMANLGRLISLRRQKLQELRLDLARLERLRSESDTRLRDARAVESRFLDEMRSRESTGHRLQPHEMIALRHYLHHLTEESAHHARAAEEVAMHCQGAHQTLSNAFTEIRGLELVLERRQAAAARQRRALQFRNDDDRHVARAAFERISGDRR
jgi:flagellar biosynthesis chaperone FliJ